MTPAQFRSTHGPCARWSTADIESYEHLIEVASCQLAEASDAGQLVVGRRAEGDRVVVELSDPVGIGVGKGGSGNHAEKCRAMLRPGVGDQ
ncbi:hypothetical protein ABZ820_22280 [Streptomyces diacarni]|uniref:hypothetical protein n=1 Tax=Streptomyces diacarni TaxID=2800381 RepID=UPI0033EF64E8